MEKSTIQDIQKRFDNEVERFSNLQTGQSATIDAPLVLELLSQAAATTTTDARRLLDVGCGAGNNALRILERLPGLEVTLLDVSGNMLSRARERVSAAGAKKVETIQQDVRQLELPEGELDLIVAAAVLHHLRNDAEWEQVFKKFYRWLRPGGSIWISDLIMHSSAAIQELMWGRYGDYLAGLGGEAYRQKVYEYVAVEDTPRPLMYQIDLLRAVGFKQIEILHKNSVFAAFGAVK